MAKNFARLRANAGSEIVFFKHSIFKKFKNEIKMKNAKINLVKKIYLCQKFTQVGFSRNGIVLDGRYTVKYSAKVVVKGKTKLKG